MFSVRSINLGCSAIDEATGHTVAYVTPQGWVDWLMVEPGQRGRHVEATDKEPHLGYIRGMKFNLHMQNPWSDRFHGIDIEASEAGNKTIITAASQPQDRLCRSECRAELRVSAETGRYEWDFTTRLKNTSPGPLAFPYVEYNNILPARTGGRFLWAPRKQFDRCLIEDKDGVVWEFPHQHVLDYWLIGRPGQDKRPLPQSSGPGNWGGFFGEEFNPLVTVRECDGEACWGICDAYYDFHCCARPEAPLQPDEEWTWRYRIHYLNAAEARPLLDTARRMPVSEADWNARSAARLGLGFNDFRKPTKLDGFDEGSGFIPDGRERFWEKTGGPDGNGMLRMVSNGPGECVWPAAVVDPTQMPPASRLLIRGKMRVEGGGRMFFRLRPHVFQWRPTPHVDWLAQVSSRPVADTSGRWVDFEVPEYASTAEDLDTELGIEVVFDGHGVGYMSCLDVILESDG